MEKKMRVQLSTLVFLFFLLLCLIGLFWPQLSSIHFGETQATSTRATSTDGDQKSSLMPSTWQGTGTAGSQAALVVTSVSGGNFQGTWSVDAGTPVKIFEGVTFVQNGLTHVNFKTDSQVPGQPAIYTSTISGDTMVVNWFVSGGSSLSGTVTLHKQ